MNSMNMDWWLNKNIQANCFELFGRILATPTTAEAIMKPIVMQYLSKEESQEGISLDAPVLRLTKESCQSLMDELWSQGIRPTNGDGNIGQLAATKAHLEDMQKIAFSFIQLSK